VTPMVFATLQAEARLPGGAKSVHVECGAGSKLEARTLAESKLRDHLRTLRAEHGPDVVWHAVTTSFREAEHAG